jgi:O-antigen/teichoic acid export membrane protein
MSADVGMPHTITSTSKSIGRQVLQVLRVARLRPFDIATAEGRAAERLRRAFWSAAASVVAKGINTLAILVSVPITLSYLGNERYGLWMTIAALVAFLEFADLGIGNVILNLVSEADGKGDVEAARTRISNAFVTLFLISASLALAFVLIYPSVNWGQFFNLSSPLARKEAGPAVIVLGACFLANLPLSIIPRIQAGYQEGYLSSIWQGISNLAGLAGLVLVVHLKAGLPWLVLVIMGSPAVGNLLNGIHLFAFLRPWLFPRWRDLNVVIAKHIVGVGLLFLILQITNAIIYSADNLIIARVLGPEAVTDYAVPSKLFFIAYNILYMFLAPLWPAYGEANARGDDSWAKNTLFRVILITLVVCVLFSLALYVFGEKILQVWTDSRVAFSSSLMAGLGVSMTLSAVIAAASLFLNAMNKIAFRAVFALLTAFFATLVKVVLAGLFGLSGVVWGQVAVSMALTLIPYSIYLRTRFALQSH